MRYDLYHNYMRKCCKAQTEETALNKIDKKKSQDQYLTKEIEDDILTFQDDFCNHAPKSQKSYTIILFSLGFMFYLSW